MRDVLAGVSGDITRESGHPVFFRRGRFGSDCPVAPPDAGRMAQMAG